MQVQVPPPSMNSIADIGLIPIRGAVGFNGHGNGVTNGYHGMVGGVSGGSVYLREPTRMTSVSRSASNSSEPLASIR